MRLPAGIIVLAIAALAALPAGASAAPSLEPYRGLGTWIDIYDDPQLAAPGGRWPGSRPAGCARSSSRRRTSSSGPTWCAPTGCRASSTRPTPAASRSGLVPAGLRRRRSRPAPLAGRHPLRSEGGEAFDSFALDIEWSGVTPVSLRNRRMLALSDRLRAEVGPDYALGAIIPNRADGLRRDYWQPFPYAELAPGTTSSCRWSTRPTAATVARGDARRHPQHDDPAQRDLKAAPTCRCI